MTQYLLEGMAVARGVGGQRVPVDLLLTWLKEELHRSYQDVRNVKREK
jgi:hypothetical protein